MGNHSEGEHTAPKRGRNQLWGDSDLPSGWASEVSCITLVETRLLVAGVEHGWIMTFHISGRSSSQLTKSYFSEGLTATTNQL